MSQQDSIQPAAVPSGGPQYAGGAFGGPSARPGEPVTHGVDIGPGGGPEVLGVTPQAQMPTGYITNLLQTMSATDTTGTLGKLYLIAKQRNV
jgi:hypothetical protein